MAINYPGPYEVRVFYDSNAASPNDAHQFRLSCDMETPADPGDPFSSWLVARRDGTSAPLDAEVDAVMTVLLPNFNTSVVFGYAELWEYEPGTFEAAFRSTYDISLNGTDALTTQNDAQFIISFRTSNGGIAKLDLRHTIYAQAQSSLFPTSVSEINDLAAVLVAADTPWIGRDNGFLIQALRSLPGFNEKMTKNRLRQV